MSQRAQEPPGGVQATALDQLMVSLRKSLASALATGEGVQATLHIGPKPAKGGERDVKIEVTFARRITISDGV